MTRRCSSCGTPAIDENSQFCNQCGERLPADETLTCLSCGKRFPDPLSRFCNRCGSSLVPAMPQTAPQVPLPPEPAPAGEETLPAPDLHRAEIHRVEVHRKVTPLVEKEPREEPIAEVTLPEVHRGDVPKQAAPPSVTVTICPNCGFANEGKSRFYCKKCGAYIPRSALNLQRDAVTEKGPIKPSGSEIRIVPDGLDELRQLPKKEVKRPREPKEAPVRVKKPAPERPSLPEAVQPTRAPKKPVPQAQPARVAAPPAPSRPAPQKQPAAQKKKKGAAWRNAWALAAVLLLVLVIAGLGLMVTNLPGGDETPAESPGLLDGLPWGLVPNLSAILNQSVPVVNDTGLNVTPTEN